MKSENNLHLLAEDAEVCAEKMKMKLVDLNELCSMLYALASKVEREAAREADSSGRDSWGRQLHQAADVLESEGEKLMNSEKEKEILSVLKDIRGDMRETWKKIADIDKRLTRVESDVGLLKYEVSQRSYGGHA